MGSTIEETKYWIGGTGNWSEGSNWSMSSGGIVPCEGAPGESDIAVFDSLSGTGACTIDVDSIIGTLYIASDTNITFFVDAEFTIKNNSSPLRINNWGGNGSGRVVLDGNMVIDGDGIVGGAESPVLIKTGSTISGNIAINVGQGNIEIEAGCDCLGLDIISDNVNNASKIGTWVQDGASTSSAVSCGACTLYRGANTADTVVDIYSADYIQKEDGTAGVIGDIRLGAGGVSGTLWLSSIGGSLVQSGNIGTLKIDDAYALSDFSRVFGSVGTLTISACSGTKELDLDNAVISSHLNVAGSSNLSITGLVKYNGLAANCVISSTEFNNCDASEGNPVYALTTGGNVDGGSNKNIVFAPATRSLVFGVLK